MKTVIQRYSLECGKVGEAIGAAVIIDHQDETSALMHLWHAMDKPPTGDGYKYFIRFPDGVEVPFDAAYTRTFGKKPVYRDNKETLYPCLPIK